MEHPVKIYATADNIISSLGFTTLENMENIRQYHSGIYRIDDTSLFHEPFMGARIDAARLNQAAREHQLQDYTRMEQLFILSLGDVIRQSGINPAASDCGFIFSTTKGNIDRDRSCSPFPHGTADYRLFWLVARTDSNFKRLYIGSFRTGNSLPAHPAGEI